MYNLLIVRRTAGAVLVEDAPGSRTDPRCAHGPQPSAPCGKPCRARGGNKEPCAFPRSRPMFYPKRRCKIQRGLGWNSRSHFLPSRYPFGESASLYEITRQCRDWANFTSFADHLADGDSARDLLRGIFNEWPVHPNKNKNTFRAPVCARSARLVQDKEWFALARILLLNARGPPRGRSIPRQILYRLLG